MQEFTLNQARHMAGIDHDDPQFLQEVKFWGWLGPCKYRIVDHQALGTQRKQAEIEGVDILIIKD
jgi:hypothetical protein